MLKNILYNTYIECISVSTPGRWEDHDQGWFGDHSKGVYVSKHADYTFFYARGRDPVAGDEGVVVLLELVTGRVRHLDARDDGAQPSDGCVQRERKRANI